MSEALPVTFVFNHWLEISLVAICMFLLISTVNLRKQTRFFQSQIEDLKTHVRAINSGNIGMSRKLQNMLLEMSDLESRQKTEFASPDNRIYEQASLLLSRGVSIEEVCQSCDISPAEAELLSIVYNAAPSVNRRLQ